MNTIHVPTLETCQRLKELGYPQDTEFYWWGNKEETKLILLHRSHFLSQDIIPIGIQKGYCSAPIVSELGERLPAIFKEKSKEYYLTCYRNDENSWVCSYTGYDMVYADTEAEARALMWIYLKKEGLI